MYVTVFIHEPNSVLSVTPTPLDGIAIQLERSGDRLTIQLRLEEAHKLLELLDAAVKVTHGNPQSDQAELHDGPGTFAELPCGTWDATGGP